MIANTINAIPHQICLDAIIKNATKTDTAEEIRETIKNAFTEFQRILKDDGFVLFKWNDHDQKLNKILKLVLDFEPLFGQKVSIRTKHSSATYWMCLIKRLEQENLNNFSEVGK